MGNVHDCKEPIIDFYPSGTNDSTHPLYHPWAVPSPDTVGLGKDVMGGTSCKGPLCFSATCWYQLATPRSVPRTRAVFIT